MDAQIILKNGCTFNGKRLGAQKSTSGELVFNTGMVGYAETLSDPSYAGQILVFTYPLIGNYGIFGDQSKHGILKFFESSKIHAKGVIVNEACLEYSHQQALIDFDGWLKKHDIPALCGVDTRALTLMITNQGSTLAKIQQAKEDEVEFFDPNQHNMVKTVSIKSPKIYNQKAKKTVMVVDNGVKNGILHSLLSRKVNVTLVPWNYDYSKLDYDGIIISNGPGDPSFLQESINILKTQLAKNKPTMGICMGHQLLAMASGAKTYKMKFGHRSQNQPCIKVGTKKIYITSQNHGYAVAESTLGKDWLPWFFNANDGSNEGIKHKNKPFFSVQFHPEASPGPTDTMFMFDDFIGLL